MRPDDIDDKQIDALLSSLEIEPPSTNFSQKIIDASYLRPQQRAVEVEDSFFDDIVNEIMSRFLAPRYAYALALTLVVGFSFGYIEDGAIVPSEDSTGSSMSIIMMDDFEGELL